MSDAIFCLESAARHADELRSPKTAEKFRAIARAIHHVVETIDEEGTQGELDRRADGLQVNARAMWAHTHGEDGSESWRAGQQRRTAREYEAARDAFVYAYRFEKAMEVLRG